MLPLAGADADPALVTFDGGVTTYAELRDAVARRAAEIPARTLVPVAEADPRRFLVEALAVLTADAVLLPLDPRGEPDVVARRLRAGRRLEAPAAMVLGTSGSSGRSKAVVLGAPGLRANIDAILDYLPVRAHPRTGVVLPFAYSYALVGQAFTTLAAGGAVVLLAGLPAARQVEAMRALDVRGLSSVPASLRLLAEAAAPGLPLGYVASAGAPLTPETVTAVRRGFPGARMFNQYGLTEASPRVTACPDDAPAFARGSVGRPLRGVEVEVLDAEGRPLPPGAQGEVVVRSPSVMLRYLDDPESTARALGPGGLRTGDRGHLDEDGFLYVAGRLDDLVKVAGERVSLDAVAATLRDIEGVRDAGVVALPDPRTDLRLAAAVVLAPGADLAAVRRACRPLHPARRPRLTAVEALPTNARGKLDRRALARLLSR